MGAYLNKPITEKHSESGGNETIKFAATSMQGWRVNQEDAHNCILDLENGWHLFAVYDGHGGPEVAKYTSANFPKFFRDREVWKADDIVKLLQDTFVDFDDHLRTDPVMMELKKIANGVEGDKKVDSDDDEDDEDKAALLEEGAAPLEQLLKKYGYEIVSNGSTTRVMRHITDVANEHLAEARAAGKKEEGGDSEDGEGSSSDKSHKRPNESPRLQRAKRAKSEVNTEEQDVEEEEATKENGAKEAKGDGKSEEEKTETETENGAGDTEKEPVLKKGKNTVPVVAKKESALDDVDVNSSDDEDYKEGEEEDGADEEEDEEESEDGEGEEQDDEEEDEEEEDEDMGEDAFGGLSGETPGEDSGTTACVCIVAPGKVIVANAGDSRAVLSRGGKAVDLSIDHKPEDQIEMDRITKAGGVVNEDGRVNGGLNLSRALGDHCYKKNKTLPLREQMISALPDVKILETTEEDDFIVVACDGIWNSLESQQVIDFVKERLGKGMGLTAICEEMCTECLADSTSGDGTGCDNMTIIIADLKPTTRAAPAAEEKEEAVEV